MTRLVAVVAVALVAGCGGKPKEEAQKKDTLTTRQRQEAIGNSGIPGAKGINKALDIVDTANARIQALDTVRN
jgi:outer membrane murein-binding lipoprotein Lpp